MEEIIRWQRDLTDKEAEEAGIYPKYHPIPYLTIPYFFLPRLLGIGTTDLLILLGV